MITIIPCFDIMKTVTDQNIIGTAAQERRGAFEEANKLMVDADVDILLTYQLFERISQRLNDDHKTAFSSLYRIDNSTKNIEEYNITRSINLVARTESKAREVIVLTSNLGDHGTLTTIKRIIVISPESFIKKINVARSLKKRGIVSSFDDALRVVFFLRYSIAE